MVYRNLLSMMTSLLIVTATIHPAWATEYFVGPRGDDANPGTAPEQAFATLQRGVDALQPGDTLTLAPGEYAQSAAREDLGSDAATTTIRAQIPGTVVLRGDVPAPEFTAVKGKRFVHSAEFDGEAMGLPQAVLEHDTRSLLSYTPDPAELEFIPGLFSYDEQNKQLFVSSSDMQPPVGRLYTVSVRSGSGIYLENPRNVVIEGLAFTGFYRRGANRQAPCLWGIPWGIAMSKPRGCVVRQCSAYLNAGGIALDSGWGNLVEQCVAFGNGSRYEATSGNIMNFGGLDKGGTGATVIRECLSFDGNWGIHQYGRMYGHVVLRQNISFNNRGSNLHIKTGLNEDNQQFGLIERSVSLGSIGAMTAKQNIMLGEWHYHTRDTGPAANIMIPENGLAELERNCADPDNLDFRLQADSRFRGAGPNGTDVGPAPYRDNIVYVNPNGSDDADGLSMATAWRTLDRATRDLRPGDTLYLAPGTYPSTLTLTSPGAGDDPVHLRGRGRDPVLIEGGISIKGGGPVRVERLTFTGPAAIAEVSDIAMNNCTFTAGLDAQGVRGLTVTHCVFPASSLKAQKCSKVMLSGNLFGLADAPAVMVDDATAIRYSNYNGYRGTDQPWSVGGAAVTLADLRQRSDAHSLALSAAVDQIPPSALSGRGPRGSALGIHHHRRTEKPPLRMIGPFVHSVSDTTANIEWWMTGPTGLTIAWGENDATQKTQSIEAHRFGTFSLTDLKPGTTYHFQLTADNLPDSPGKVTFTTQRQPAKPQVYYVAPDGDDERSGLSRQDAWRTANHAAARVAPGDTVLLAGGSYRESVRLRATGQSDRPITFKAMPGQRVRFDGVDRSLNNAFISSHKHHMKFDGFYFKGYSYLDTYHLPWSDRAPGNGTSGTFDLYRSHGIDISRCFNDGRGGGYAPGLVQAVHCADLHVSNCVNAGTMGGMVTFFGCPNLKMEHSVCLGNYIYALVGVNELGQSASFTRNIFTDASLPTKAAAPLFELGNVETLVEGDNCYLLRNPDEVKKPLFFYDRAAYDRTAVMFGLRMWDEAPMRITELTQMSLADYQRQFNPQSRFLVADPAFAGAVGADLTGRNGQMNLPSDVLLGRDNLDFPDVFATHPEVVHRDMGLQRQAFEDFHFSAAAAP